MDIFKLIKEVSLFGACTHDDFRYLSRIAAVKWYNQDEIIMHEGDYGDAMYIVADGKAQAFTEDKDENRIVLAELDVGHYFGEQAYLNHHVRSSSVKASTNVQIIELRYDLLTPLFKRSPRLHLFLQKASLGRSISNLQAQLHQIDTYVRKELFTKSERTILKYLNTGEALFKKGDASDCVFFVSSGAIALVFEDGSKDNQFIINKNSMVGEVGVLNNQPRAATARATMNSIVISIPRNEFLAAANQALGLRSLILAFNKTYALPKPKAIIEQYIGMVERQESVFTKYKLHNGKVVLCGRIVDMPVFTCRMQSEKPDRVYLYKNESEERRLFLKNQTLVGMVVLGDWDETNSLCEAILKEDKLETLTPEQFAQTGSAISAV